MFFNGRFTNADQVLRVLIGNFTGMEYGLFFCVLSIALSVTSVPIASCSVASSLYAVLLPVALTIVHFDSTYIHSLHNILAILLVIMESLSIIGRSTQPLVEAHHQSEECKK